MNAPARVVPIEVVISRREVLRLLGVPQDRQPPERIGRLLDAALEEARALAHARGGYLVLPAARAGDLGLSVAGPEFVVGLVTAGGAIEERAAERMRAGEATRALLLDAAGSAAAEDAADRLCALIGAGTGLEVPAVPCRISPGYGSWPLSAQRDLFRVLPSAEVGVRLLPSLLMSPLKSVSFALPRFRVPSGSPEATGASAASTCARCGMKDCLHRKTGAAGKE